MLGCRIAQNRADGALYSEEWAGRTVSDDMESGREPLI
jgi:hypothetical protein